MTKIKRFSEGRISLVSSSQSVMRNRYPGKRDPCVSKIHSNGDRRAGYEQLAAKKRQTEIRKKQEDMHMKILAEELKNAKLEDEKARNN